MIHIAARGRRGARRQSLQKHLDREANAVAAAGTVVAGTFAPDEEVIVKRVIVAVLEEGSGLMEWTLTVHRQGSATVADRDKAEAVVKTGYASLGDKAYVDFTTSIRLNRSDELGLVLENVGSSASVTDTALVVLYREM